MLVGLLANESIDSVKKWAIACDKRGIHYEIISLLSHDWLRTINSKPFDFFLSRPSGEKEYLKTAYDERLHILNIVLNKPVYPSYNEDFFYENKRTLSYYLEAKNIPHPHTDVFYSKQEALLFAESCSVPIVGKTNIGASGSGVNILKTKGEVKRYINKAFSRKGIKRRFGPNRVTGTPKKWLSKAIKSPRFLINKLKQYIGIYKDGQKGYLLLQSYIEHDFEWRVAKIGNSYFAHKKVKVGEKASGSKGIDYVNPPIAILDFVKDICDKNRFNFMAIDIFEDGHGNYLVNEMQTIFGHVQPYIMKVDNAIGRYIYNNGWQFEIGDFNTNESYDLRLDYVLSLY